MVKNYLLSVIFVVIGLSTAFAQYPFDGKIRPDSTFDKTLRLGELDALLRAVPGRKDLQLERLAAYFFHQRINQHRLENRRTTLYWDDRMWLAARNHNVYMTKTKYGHEEAKTGQEFTGESPSDRIQFVMYNGFKMSLYGENILMNFSAFYQRSIIDNAQNIAAESFEQWKNSPPHNKNMLDPDFFAHGTSFYRGRNGVSQIFGTTNFGNASDFVENEIAITWNDSLARRYPPLATTKPKPFVSAKWSVQQAENDLLGVVKARMPKHASAYNPDFAKAAEMGVKNHAGKPLPKKITDTKTRYQKAAANADLKVMLSSLKEVVCRFEFSKEQLQSKSALKVVDEWAYKYLPIPSKIKNWGGKCVLTENNNEFVCEIALVFISN